MLLNWQNGENCVEIAFGHKYQQQIKSENSVFSAGFVCDFMVNECAFCRCVGI